VLDIHRVPFEDLDGNARGYAKRGRKIAVSSPTGTQTVAQGGHGQYTIKIPSAVGTFSGPVTLTCSNLPAQATCAFSPNPITPGPDGVTTQLTITTAVPSSAMTVPHIVGPPPAALPAILLAMMLTALVGWWRVRRESLRWLVAPCLLFGALLATTFMAGCGGGGYPLAKVGSTPSGTYTITVTGTSGTMEHTTAVTLNVTAYWEGIRITVIRRRLGPILAAALLCAAAHGQDVSPFEVSLDYSYVRANASPSQCGCFSMNGGSGAFAASMGRGISVVADVAHLLRHGLATSILGCHSKEAAVGYS
jgi:hypothetical protein